jgi:hypothetical protein
MTNQQGVRIMLRKWKDVKYVVRDNKEIGTMLAEICPLDPLACMEVISSSKIRGSIMHAGSSASTYGHNIRRATVQDFDLFRVQLPPNYKG